VSQVITLAIFTKLFQNTSRARSICGFRTFGTTSPIYTIGTLRTQSTGSALSIPVAVRSIRGTFFMSGTILSRGIYSRCAGGDVCRVNGGVTGGGHCGKLRRSSCGGACWIKRGLIRRRSRRSFALTHKLIAVICNGVKTE